ncbi:MAG: peptide deformylase [Fischerella sp. CENA71]|nr:peptide deformylase [Fischerella sp. CENA71]
MAKLLPIIQLGNPNLFQKSSLVDNILDEEIQELIDDLMTTVAHNSGQGIAAPQVAKFYRLFIITPRPYPKSSDASDMKPIIMINPRILAHSSDVVKDWEGCFSIPGIRGLVPRFRTVRVEYTDRNGSLLKQELTDSLARGFQHEYDHLNGIVFLDQLQSTSDIITEQEYQKQILGKT